MVTAEVIQKTAFRDQVQAQLEALGTPQFFTISKSLATLQGFQEIL